MNNEEMALEEYKIYSQHKEEFVNRSFKTNKFYLILIIFILLSTFIMKDLSIFYNLTFGLIFSLIGMFICTMWWINVDSYSLLIKVKLSKVLEVMEQNFPVKPYTMEYEAIKEYRKNKKAFMFSDIQKILALLILLLFLIIFITELVPIILNGYPLK